MEFNDDENIPIQQSNNVQRIIRFLMSMKILNKTANCNKEKCQYREMKLRTRELIEQSEMAWRCMKCSNWKSLRYGSYFENTRIPIYKIVKIIHYFITSVKIEQACQIVQLSKSTVIDWFQRFRYLTALDLDKKEIKLGGKGKIFEIDESMYARVKHFKEKDLQYMS